MAKDYKTIAKKLKLEGGNCTEKFSTLPKPGTENPE